MESAGKLVIGTVPKYGYLGGALVIFDLESGEREVYWNVVDQQSVTAVTSKDGLIYGGTNVWGGLGVDPTATEAKLFAWDIANKEKVFEIVPVPGKRAITDLIAAPDGNIWGVAEGTLFIFDPVTRQIIHTQKLATLTYNSAVWRDAQLQIGTDGNVYGVLNKEFFVINVATKKKTVIRDVGARNWLGQDDFGRFYLTEGAHLLQVTIPELLARPLGAELTVSSTGLMRGQTSDLAVQGLLEKGRTIQRLEKRSNIQWFSSDPSVVSIVNGKAEARNPGVAQLWAQVNIDGAVFETNHVSVTVAVTLDSLENELTAFIQAGAIQNAMASQLTNSLKQARHFIELGDANKAKKHLDDFLKHLNNPALSSQITDSAKAVLGADAAGLAGTL